MKTCQLCSKGHLQSLLNLGDHPIAHRLLTDPTEVEYVHPVNLCLCDSCGLIQLKESIPPDYLYTDYNWLSSWKWNPHENRIVEQVLNLFINLNSESMIAEVGSNDGSFLSLLRENGYKNLIGVEPTKDGQHAAQKKEIKTIGSYFNKETATELVTEVGKCDLFVSRQMLEHVAELTEFREAMMIALRPGGYVYFEVPNFEFNLKSFDYSAIWEEHVNYFTLETLSRFLKDANIRIIHSETANFCGEALMVFGKHEENLNIKSDNTISEKQIERAFAYKKRWPIFRNKFFNYLKNFHVNGKKIAVYGAGCRACSLINFTGVADNIDFCFDDQIEKQGKYLPGSHLFISHSKYLKDSNVDLCLLAVNEENEDKVIKNIKLGEQNLTVASLLPPSKRILSIW